MDHDAAPRRRAPVRRDEDNGVVNRRPPRTGFAQLFAFSSQARPNRVDRVAGLRRLLHKGGMDALSEMRTIAACHAQSGGVSTSLPRLRCLLRTSVTEPASVTEEALLALVLQGSKRTVLGTRTFDFFNRAGLQTGVIAESSSLTAMTSSQLPSP